MKKPRQRLEAFYKTATASATARKENPNGWLLGYRDFERLLMEELDVWTRQSARNYLLLGEDLGFWRRSWEGVRFLAPPDPDAEIVDVDRRRARARGVGVPFSTRLRALKPKA